jgi:hypothetical protein
VCGNVLATTIMLAGTWGVQVHDPQLLFFHRVGYTVVSTQEAAQRQQKPKEIASLRFVEGVH